MSASTTAITAKVERGVLAPYLQIVMSIDRPIAKILTEPDRNWTQTRRIGSEINESPLPNAGLESQSQWEHHGLGIGELVRCVQS